MEPSKQEFKEGEEVTLFPFEDRFFVIKQIDKARHLVLLVGTFTISRNSPIIQKWKSIGDIKYRPVPELDWGKLTNKTTVTNRPINQHCTPKQPTPCFQYHRDKPEALDEFLRVNGSDSADYDAAGTATLYSNIKGEKRLAYLKHGYWLRCLGPAQFSACSDTTFQETYQLVESAEN